MSAPRKYPDELRERATRLAVEARGLARNAAGSTVLRVLVAIWGASRGGVVINKKAVPHRNTGV
jgi:hypothetical protein